MDLAATLFMVTALRMNANVAGEYALWVEVTVPGPTTVHVSWDLHTAANSSNEANEVYYEVTYYDIPEHWEQVPEPKRVHNANEYIIPNLSFTKDYKVNVTAYIDDMMIARAHKTVYAAPTKVAVSDIGANFIQLMGHSGTRTFSIFFTGSNKMNSISGMMHISEASLNITDLMPSTWYRIEARRGDVGFPHIITIKTKTGTWTGEPFSIKMVSSSTIQAKWDVPAIQGSIEVSQLRVRMVQNQIESSPTLKLSYRGKPNKHAEIVGDLQPDTWYLFELHLEYVTIEGHPAPMRTYSVLEKTWPRVSILFLVTVSSMAATLLLSLIAIMVLLKRLQFRVKHHSFEHQKEEKITFEQADSSNVMEDGIFQEETGNTKKKLRTNVANEINLTAILASKNNLSAL